MLTKKTPNEKGFTLIEIMVVLIIISIISTIAVTLFSRFNSHQNLATVAENLQKTIEAAETQAILQPQLLGLRTTEKGYQFYYFAHQKWLPLIHDKLSNAYAFNHIVAEVQWNPEKTSDKKNKNKAEKREKKSNKIRYIELSPAGDVTPALIILSDTEHHYYQLQLAANGETTLKNGS